MYSKTIIMFFGLALYLLQCQGAQPTPEQREIISNIIWENVGQEGTGYGGLEDVLTKVIAQLNLSVVFPRKEELLLESKAYYDIIRHKYSFEEIRTAVEDFVGSESLENGWTIEDCMELVVHIFCARTIPSGDAVRYEELYHIIKDIKSHFNITNDFPTVEEHNLALSDHAHYTADQVEKIVIDRLF